MTSWSDFADAAPELAGRVEERFSATGLVAVGTLRADGWPRVSPVEPLITGGQLYLGMMWQSRKALDLLRDPRCVVHTAIADESGGEGDGKVYGRAIDVDDDDERDAYGRALDAAIGWRPKGSFHLFRIAIVEVAWVRLGAGPREVLRWEPGRPVQHLDAP